VDFGIHIGTRGCLTSRENVMAAAQRAETLGYAYLGVADHLIVPMQTGVRYPYTADGIWPGAPTGECFDCIATLAFLAGCTERLKLLTSVAVVPHRPAVLAAKLFLTADVLSGGRVIAGVGTGWMREEFEALGTPPYEERGAVTDEYLDAFRELWTQDAPRFEGRHVKFADILFEPKPVQKPYPPIWVGGESGPALRRTARIGDAWYPIGTNPQHRLDSMKRFQAGVERLRRLTREAGRDPSKMGLAYRVTSWGKSLPDLADDGERRLFSGETADVVADLRAFRDFGVGYVDFNFDGATADAMLSNMRHFREDVLAKV